MIVAGVVRRGRAAARAARVRARTRDWDDRSRLFVLGDALGWALDDEAAYVATVARAAGYRLGPPSWARFARRQVVFHTSHFAGLDPVWTGSSHRLGLAYFHGRPRTPGYPEFDHAFEALTRDPDRFARVQVTHHEMEEIVVAAGVAPERVLRIPIGIELDAFPLGDCGRRTASREALGLPPDAIVVGSFQKDGVGWDEGLEPKLVKGPDVLVEALECAAREVDDLHVLLTGPARGYVRRELARLGVPYRHVYAKDRAELARAYRALDVYVVASRQEGGPKGVLESMASGVPLVTTRVGQAQEIAADGENALVVDVDDGDAIAGAIVRLRDEALATSLVAPGRTTAERYAYERLDPLWGALLAQLVERDG